MNELQARKTNYKLTLEEPLRVLDANLIHQLDEALMHVGTFGEVRLVVVKGVLRYIQVMYSETVQRHR
ncbi:MAG: hypothetical protein GY759_18135 [Chloroflexi bacterium]|nr:hypothetical protein [Chloroflexota bacterium]